MFVPVSWISFEMTLLFSRDSRSYRLNILGGEFIAAEMRKFKNTVVYKLYLNTVGCTVDSNSIESVGWMAALPYKETPKKKIPDNSRVSITTLFFYHSSFNYWNTFRVVSLSPKYFSFLTPLQPSSFNIIKISFQKLEIYQIN